MMMLLLMMPKPPLPSRCDSEEARSTYKGTERTHTTDEGGWNDGDDDDHTNDGWWNRVLQPLDNLYVDIYEELQSFVLTVRSNTRTLLINYRMYVCTVYIYVPIGRPCQPETMDPFVIEVCSAILL